MSLYLTPLHISDCPDAFQVDNFCTTMTNKINNAVNGYESTVLQSIVETVLPLMKVIKFQSNEIRDLKLAISTTQARVTVPEEYDRHLKELTNVIEHLTHKVEGAWVLANSMTGASSGNEDVSGGLPINAESDGKLSTGSGSTGTAPGFAPPAR